jgi:sirohydrochlorin ferrochelatase
MSAREINDETEIFTEALGASLAQGNLTVDQLKRQLEGGLAYVEAQGADNVAEELLVSLAALDKLSKSAKYSIHSVSLDGDEFRIVGASPMCFR